MAKNLDYTVISPSLLKDASIHPTSSRFSLGIIEELTEAYIQSLKRNLDDVCMLNDSSIDRSSAPVLPTCKSCPGPSSEFSPYSPTLN